VVNAGFGFAVMSALAERPAKDFSLQEIESLERSLLDLPQVDVPLTHIFAPNVYWREVRMPKGSFIIGHLHKTEHLNVILTGKVRVLMEGKMHTIEAPLVIKSGPGVRKILYIEEECRWATVHPTETTDLEELAEELIIKSDSYKAHHELEEFQRLLLEDAA
jgi:hypothetical protein